MCDRCCHDTNNNRGHIQVIKGPMFASKTTEIMRLVNRWRAIGKKVCVITHVNDKRGQGETCMLWSHNGVMLEAHKLSQLLTHLDYPYIKESDVIAIDECQFFNHKFEDGTYDLIEFVSQASARGQHIIAAGLTADAFQRPFGLLYAVETMADRETIDLTALCNRCRDGTEARFTVFKQGHVDVDGPEQVSVGGAEKYESVCMKCLDK